jgi:hypothetical protein
MVRHTKKMVTRIPDPILIQKRVMPSPMEVECYNAIVSSVMSNLVITTQVKYSVSKDVPV